jgi:hypothetical protein
LPACGQANYHRDGSPLPFEPAKPFHTCDFLSAISELPLWTSAEWEDLTIFFSRAAEDGTFTATWRFLQMAINPAAMRLSTLVVAASAVAQTLPVDAPGSETAGTVDAGRFAWARNGITGSGTLGLDHTWSFK